MPSNVDPADPANPFADYSVERLYEFLSSYQLPRDIGSRFEYSNIGGALLGHALAQRAGVDYGTLVEKRIAEPLGMSSTRIQLTPEMKSRLAVGHAYGLEPTPNWDLGSLVGAGAPCDDYDACPDGYYCDVTCVPLLSAGAACTAYGQCAEGLACVNDVCAVPKLTDGDMCDGDVT